MSGTATTHLTAIRDGAKAYASRVKEAKKVQVAADKEAKKVAADAKKVQSDADKEAKKVAAETKKVQVAADKEAKKVAAEAKKVQSEADKEAKKVAADADKEAKKVAADAKKVQSEADKEAKKVAAEAKKVQATADKEAKKVAAEAKKVAADAKKVQATADKEAKKVAAEADKAAKKVAAEDEAKKVAAEVADKEVVVVADKEVVVEVADKEEVVDGVVATPAPTPTPDTPKKKMKAAVAPTPWMGQGNALMCQAIITNHALFTQCTKTPTAGEFCAACDKAFAKKGSHTNGTVADRMAVAADEYVSPTGKKVVGYGKVLATMGISTEDAVAHLATQGIELADEQFVVPEKAKKGRKPAANKRTDADVGDDIAAIVAHAAKGLQGFQDSSEDDADSLVVDEWTFHGTPYLRDETTNKIYTPAFPHSQIGSYNPDNGSIVRLE